MSETLLNREWLRESFRLDPKAANEAYRAKERATTAMQKFTDSSLGGNFAINMPYQFTPNADPRVKSLNPNSDGMGRWYAETQDDPSQLLYMRMGVPIFNSITQFLANSYSPAAGELIRTGQVSFTNSFFRTAGKLVGFAGVLAFPGVPWIYKIIYSGVKILRSPTARFYHMRPEMFQYWSAVNTMVNSITSKMNLTARADFEGEGYDEKGNIKSKNPDEAQAQANLEAMLPPGFTHDGVVDVFYIAGRAQRMLNAAREIEDDIMESSSTLEEFLESRHANLASDKFSRAAGSGATIHDLEKDFRASKMGSEGHDIPGGSDANSGKVNSNGEVESFWDFGSTSVNWALTIGEEFWKTESRSGSQWACFKVIADREVSESFSNSSKESDIASTINAKSGEAQSQRFNFAGGNLTDNVVGNLLEGVVGAATSFVSGVGEWVGLSGLSAFVGAAFVDIPEHWEDSQSNLPEHSYTLELRCPYGDPFAYVQDIVIPMSMVMCAGLPRSTGKTSYASPFLCEAYLQGRIATRLGMIGDINITRGVGNLGWMTSGRPTAVDVSFTIKDLSTTLHMPIAEGIGWSEYFGGSVLNDPSVYDDYLSTLAAMTKEDMTEAPRRISERLDRLGDKWSQLLNPNRLAMALNDTGPGRLAMSVKKGLDVFGIGD